jgi:hypothetical protein
MADGVEGPLEVDVQGPVNEFVGGVLDGRGNQKARVVYQYVQAAKGFDGFVHGPFQFGPAGNVAAEGEERGPGPGKLLPRLGQFLLVNVGDSHPGPLPGHIQGKP